MKIGPAAVAAAAGSLAIFLPFATVKANRLDSGTDLFPLDPVASGTLPLAILLAAALSLILAAVWEIQKKEAEATFFAGWLSFALTTAALAVTAFHLQAIHSNSLLAPTWGFWLQAGAGLAASAGRTARPRLRIAAVLAVAGAVTLFFSNSIWRQFSLSAEFLSHGPRFLVELGAHFLLAGTAVGAAVLIGVPLGVRAFHSEKSRGIIFNVVNGIQTIPSLALFGLMMPPLSALSHAVPGLRALGVEGIGPTPALIALTLYALLPLVRSTYTGLAEVPQAARDAGLGMGMTKRQLFFAVEVPLALPQLVNGLRLSAVQTVGNTVVAALIGAGGLGVFVFQGLGQAAPDLVLVGVFPVLLLALGLDRGLAWTARGFTAKGRTA